MNARFSIFAPLFLRRVAATMAALGVLALAADAVLRVLVVRAFEGHGPALVQRVLAHWPHRSLGEWIRTIDLRLARPYFFGVLLVVAVLAFVAVIFERREVYRRWVGPARAAELGWVRAVVSVAALSAVVVEDLPSLALVDPSVLRSHIPFVSLAWLHPVVTDAAVLAGLQLATAFTLVLAAVGLAARVTVPVATVLYFVFGAVLRSGSHVFHTGLLPLYALAVLSLGPSGAGFSLDALRLSRRGAAMPPPSARYGWVRYAVWAAVSVPYLQLAVSKLQEGGLLWWAGENLKTYIVTDVLNGPNPDATFPFRFPWVPMAAYSFFGLSGLLIEGLYPVSLVSRRLRRFVPLLVCALHFGIWRIQAVRFIDAMIVPLVFLDGATFARLRDRTGRVLSRADDGSAGLLGPAVVAAAFVLCLVTQLGFKHYPVVAWHMYAPKNLDTVARYTQILVCTASGQCERSDLSDAIGYFRGAPWALDNVDLGAGWAKTEAVLASYTRVRNAGKAPPDRVATIEVEEWAWDFEKAAQDPRRGTRLRNRTWRAPSDDVVASP